MSWKVTTVTGCLDVCSVLAAQVKELGFYFRNCPTASVDFNKVGAS